MTDVSLDQARSAKSTARATIGKGSLVSGIGLTLSGDSYALKVNLARAPVAADALPKRIDGVPVVYEVIGSIASRR